MNLRFVQPVDIIHQHDDPLASILQYCLDAILDLFEVNRREEVAYCLCRIPSTRKCSRYRDIRSNEIPNLLSSCYNAFIQGIRQAVKEVPYKFAFIRKSPWIETYRHNIVMVP